MDKIENVITEIWELEKYIEKFINKYEIQNLWEICNCGGIQPGHQTINFDDCQFEWDDNELELISKLLEHSQLYIIEIQGRGI